MTDHHDEETPAVNPDHLRDAAKNINHAYTLPIGTGEAQIHALMGIGHALIAIAQQLERLNDRAADIDFITEDPA